ncbi:M14 family zinc carboxypeptidase [Saccharibacillus sp. CPCC 101409]|uniref:M14 family zinc carboxypeptidase n=1 Tax=Saccharibacillus sp. CPCC 101409 TaxID=3058041 RepID=UPI002671F7F9|nr:M14 family zinc carboxypeptidase [Saccharibacillus sp. CPCC 101409]MDO3411269.1 M14 family zinc carboxypeptidase [Saccharibacillus sp. CPCC 101409]
MKKFWTALLALAIAVPILAPAGGIQAASAKIVNSSEVYTYGVLTRDIRELAERYPELIEYQSIGKTPYGREIWAVGLGGGEAAVFFNGSHHAREWLTTTLNMTMIEQYAMAYTAGGTFEGYNVRDLLGKTKIWFVPMVNPDGVALQQAGLQSFPVSAHKALIAMNDGSDNFKRWKANAQGIDLNRQYDTNWANLVNNYYNPHWMGHKGTAPVTTLENKALVAFTYEIDPEIAVSYHSAGRILYWNFRTPAVNYARDKRLADIFTSLTGYSQVSPSFNANGGGGYTDWFIQQFGRPAFTPEIGIKNGETSLPLSAFTEEWRRNKKIGLWIAQEGYALWAEKNKNAVKPVDVLLDGRKIAGEPAAFVEGGTTYVLHKPLLSAFGYRASWDGASKTVTSSGPLGTVRFTLGSKQALIGGKAVTLSAAPRMHEGQIYVPARLVGQATGASLALDRATGTLSLTSPPVAIEPIEPVETEPPAANPPAETAPAESVPAAPVPGTTGPVEPAQPAPAVPTVPGTVVPNG